MYRELDELVRKAKLGDKESKEEILKRLEGLIRNKIKKYYNNRYEYEDLIQEGNLVILESIDSYDERKGVYFLGYIKTMLRYTYLNKHNDKKFLSLNIGVGDDGEGDLLDMLISEEDSPMDKVLKKEEESMIRLSLSNLTERQRNIIIAYYIERLSISDIAKRMGITYRTVFNTKKTALVKMKKSLV